MATVVSKSNVPSIKIDRHCAYCLNFLPADLVKLCGKCRRRAYCSSECQKADWSQKAGSQGHKKWCDLDCGEEDIDWEVKAVAGKGLGVVAKRPIPAFYRIMIDANRPLTHPGINDLTPIGGDLNEKIVMNSFENPETNSLFLGLRVARINHSCAPNADRVEDESGAYIVFARRDIEAGEEITIAYLFLSNTLYRNDQMPSPDKVRFQLALKWKIYCDEACFCTNPELFWSICEMWTLQRLITNIDKTANFDDNVQLIERYLKLADELHSPIGNKSIAFNSGFQFGIMRQSTVDVGIDYLMRFHELVKAVFHPTSDRVTVSKKYLDDPTSHVNYLATDKE